MLSQEAQYANVFKDIHSEYLISLGKFCDNGCTDILDKKIHVVKGNNLVLSGNRNQMDGLRDTPLTSPVLPPSTI